MYESGTLPSKRLIVVSYNTKPFDLDKFDNEKQERIFVNFCFHCSIFARNFKIKFTYCRA